MPTVSGRGRDRQSPGGDFSRGGANPGPVTPEPTAVGIAWAGGPWIATVFAEEGFAEAAVAEEVGTIWGTYGEHAERIVVGLPVGLVESGDPERRCDELARVVVGPRADAIVTPPVREATRRRRFPAARRVHERLADAELSEAGFALAPGIASLDDLLQEVPESRTAVVGSHPEVAYRAFAGEPLEYEFDTAGGYAERMRALADHDRDAPPTVQEVAETIAGADVAIHHVLDALALGYTARPGPGELRTLPPDPPEDETGLPMGIAYRAAEPLDGT